jgi:multidrug efflux system outer membrane protein
VEVPASYGEAQAAASTAPAALDTEWWKLFGDPALTALEEQARGANQDLQLAIARVAEARSTARIAQADFYPIITGDPSYHAVRVSENRPNAPTTGTPSNYTTDIGAVRPPTRSTSGAAARSSRPPRGARQRGRKRRGGADARRGRRLRLLRAAGARRAGRDPSRQHPIFADQVRLTELASARPVSISTSRRRARSSPTRGRSSPTSTASAPRCTHWRCCAASRADFAIAPQPPTSRPADSAACVAAARAPAGRGRSRAEPVAANAEVGIAEAFFQVRLTGAAGFEAPTSATWSTGRAGSGRSGRASPRRSSRGRLRANLSGPRRYGENVAAYRQTVLARSATSKTRRRRAPAREQATGRRAHRGVVAVSFRSQYDHGIADYLQVIVAQATKLSLELQAEQIREARLDATVLLVKSIGGGW